MEVKKEAVDVFHEGTINLQEENMFNMAFTMIKRETSVLELENVMIPSINLISCIKTEPKDEPEIVDLAEFSTISNKIEPFDNAQSEEYYVNRKQVINIKNEVEDMDFKSIKTELLNEECDLPTVKIEIETPEYYDEEPCSSKSKNTSATCRKTALQKIIKKRKRYPCPVCLKIYPTPTSRKRHLNAHFKKRQCVVCPHCGHVFKRLSHYLMHSRIYYVKPKANLPLTNTLKFSCKVCLQKFNSKKTLAEHFKIHYSKPYECKICFKQYTVKSTLKRHLAALHSVLKPYKCEICCREFALPCQYKSHMQNHKFGKQFTCDICSKGFYQKSSLIRHRIVHAGIKFKCNLCSKEYTRKVTLESHMRLHSGEHEFKCHICLVEKRFTSKGALRLHLMNHAGDKPHKCEICSQRFLERQKLLKHLKTHEKAKNFCEFCSVSFLYKVRLQRHLLMVHGENPFKCLKCGEKYATQRDLNLHASIHVEFKMYECEICSKQFTKRAAYVRHLGGHGQNPFSCAVCSQTFSSERGLREHYAIHPGEKPFHCDVCLKGFHHKRSLHKHICEGKPVTPT